MRKYFAKNYYALIVIALCAVSTAFCLREAALGLSMYRSFFPDVAILKTQFPVADGKEGRKNYYHFQKTKPRTWVHLRELPKHVISAILLSEDSDFFQHPGYSVEGIRYALEQNRKSGGKNLRGGSTITQQVVKNLFLSPEKTLSRKVRELLLAVELERKVSKSRILETYLNIAEWGNDIYGIEEASHKYFLKPAANLSAKEAAMLAFMLPNPDKYRHSIASAGRDGGLTQFAQRRVDTILDKLWRTGKISDSERADAAREHAPEAAAGENSGSSGVSPLSSEL